MLFAPRDKDVEDPLDELGLSLLAEGHCLHLSQAVLELVLVITHYVMYI